MAQQQEVANKQPFERIPSGVPGLDTVLKGGFLKGGVYLLLGAPGTGKTVLGNQICFNHLRTQSGRAVYVTLLAESHSRMMGNLSAFDYFEDNLVGKSIHYLSGYRALEQEGLAGLLNLIATAVRDHKATLLLVDGVSTIGDLEQTTIAFRKFVHGLNTYLSTSGCTAFLLSSMEGHLSHPEHTMVDGILALQYRQLGLRSTRQLRVTKFRGSAHLHGKHGFQISHEGIRVFPRMESLEVFAESIVPEPGCRSLGISALDRMLGGGLPCNSIACLMGPAGTGKSIIGLHFLAEGANRGETGIYFGFYEAPIELLQKADHFGLKLRKAVEQGTVSIEWNGPLELELDQLGQKLLDAIRRLKAKRVFFDGMDGLRSAAAFPDRVNRFFIALTRQLKHLGVTLLYCEETSLFQSFPGRHVGELSALNETLMYMRFVDVNKELTRVISIIKVRSNQFDPSVRKVHIMNGAIELSEAFESEEAILANIPRLTTNVAKPRRSNPRAKKSRPPKRKR